MPILANLRARGSRSFSVELTDVSAGATVGPTPRIEVTILGES